MSATWRDCFDDLRRKLQLPLWSELHPILEALIRASTDVSNRESTNYDDVSLLGELLSNTDIADANVADARLCAIKLMRNLCAGVPRNQRHFLQTGASDKIVHLMRSLLDNRSVCWNRDQLLTAALQFLGNMCSGYPEGQAEVWDLCYPTVFRGVMECGVCEVTDICCMVVHVCTLNNMERRMQLCSRTVDSSDIIATPTGNRNLIATILHSMGSHSEWIFILLEALVQCIPLSHLYSCLEPHPQELVTLLTFICTRLTPGGSVEGLGGVLSQENSHFLSHYYTRLSSNLLDAGGEKLNPLHSGGVQDFSRCQEFSVFKSSLGLLCHFSSFEECLMHLQCDLIIAETTLALLRHLATLDGSVGSAKHRTKLSTVSPSGDEEKHPLFAVKTNLVRLIANLCYQCPVVQMKVKETDSIPLILNQCNIDHLNPYIMQWAVFAVRNLCEDNPANQAFIAHLEQQGIAEAAKLLDFGCVVAMGDDGKIKRLRTVCDTRDD